VTDPSTDERSEPDIAQLTAKTPDDKLDEVETELKSGRSPSFSVREFLMWWGAQRRGINVISVALVSRSTAASTA
jgi:hypothetical protein